MYSEAERTMLWELTSTKSHLSFYISMGSLFALINVKYFWKTKSGNKLGFGQKFMLSESLWYGKHQLWRLKVQRHSFPQRNKHTKRKEHKIIPLFKKQALETICLAGSLPLNIWNTGKATCRWCLDLFPPHVSKHSQQFELNHSFSYRVQ